MTVNTLKIFLKNACLSFILSTQLFFNLDCGIFPKISNANKTVIDSEFKNETHQVETHVRYDCHSGFVYSLDNSNIRCTDEGFDNEVGRCVKGALKHRFSFTFVKTKITRIIS